MHHGGWGEGEEKIIVNNFSVIVVEKLMIWKTWYPSPDQD